MSGHATVSGYGIFIRDCILQRIFEILQYLIPVGVFSCLLMLCCMVCLQESLQYT